MTSSSHTLVPVPVFSGTVNWAGSSALAGYISGFLNVQIEHHMAPQMPMHNLPEIRRDCMQLARHFDLPYQDVGDGFEALRITIDGLRTTTDRELSRREKCRSTSRSKL